jgi:rhodanese-related sulfurtransferase
LCGKALSKETISTIGDQRRVNYALRPMSQEAFVDLVTTDQPEAPAYFTYDAVLNSRERPTLDQALRELQPLTLGQLLAAQRSGAQVLDTRDPVEFASAHLAGSINIGLSGQYATWAGTILETTHPIVIVAQPGAETESAMRLGRIGFDRVCGFLEGGLAAAAPRGPEDSASQNDGQIVSTDRLSPEIAAQRMASPEPPLAIDVRSPRERAEKWIPETVHRSLSSLRTTVSDLPRTRPIMVFCAGGYRSSIAASLLQRDGFTNVSELAGGIAAWEAAGLPVSRG